MIPKFLTKDYPLDEQYFFMPRFALKIVGFYPETPQTRLVRCWALFNFSVLAYGSYAELKYGIHFLTIDVPTALDALCPVASSIMALVKMISIWWYHKEMKFLIQRVRVLNDAQDSLEKNKVKRNYFPLATQLTFIVYFFGFLTSNGYTLRNIWFAWKRYQNEEPFLFECPFKMMFHPVLLRMPFYPIFYLISHFHGYITVSLFSGGDGIFFGLCIYFTTLLKALSFDLEAILKDLSANQELRKSTEEEVRIELLKIIDRHNEIVDLIALFSKVMAPLTLAHFITSSMIIGMALIDLLLFPGLGILIYVVYTISVTTEVFIYCLGGSAVIESSINLAETAYLSYWYSHSLKIQKMVLIIMIRAQRAIVVKLPFIAPDLPVFTSIIRFTGSLIALAKELIG